MGVGYSVSMNSDSIQVSTCPAERRTEALKALHAGLPDELRTGLVEAIDVVRTQGEEALDGLLIAEEGSRLSAVWAQLMPGRLGMVWPPAAASPEAEALLHAAGRFLDHHCTTMTQVLLAPTESALAELLTRCDYRHLADLDYLTAEREVFPSIEPPSPLRFEPADGDQTERLCHLVERTYEDTCDCPAVGGLRATADVLASYRATGRYDPKLWLFVRREGRDVGVLLLTRHLPHPHWELVYMGIVPEARGNGFGWQVSQHALWRAGQGGAERLVLAVDQANRPAMAAYQRAGFARWDTRRVFARLAGGASL